MFDAVDGSVDPPDAGSVEIAVGLLRVAQPGPEVMAALRTIEPRSVSAGVQVDLLVAWERAASWVAAAQQEVLAALDAGPDAAAAEVVSDAMSAGVVSDAMSAGVVSDAMSAGVVSNAMSAGVASDAMSADDWTREEVAAALHLSACTADRRLQVARGLVRRLHGVRRALESGAVDYRKAAAIAEATESLDPQTASAVEARVLPKAPDQTLAELRRTLRRVVIAADPRTAVERHREAVAERYVRMWPADDGMAELYAKLPAEDAAIVMTALDTLAARTDLSGGGAADLPGGRAADSSVPPIDSGLPPIEARRADALTRLALAALADPDLPTRHGRRPHIQLTVSAETVLGDSEEPGELAGYGPVTADTARRIAAQGEWRRLLIEPATGRLLDYGRTTYRPPADLAQFLLARDRVCGFPGCNVPATRCDLDHAVPFGRGPTSAANMGALCRRHHRAKHEGRWKLTRDGDRGCTWTSPAGKSYGTTPPAYPGAEDPAPSG